MKLDTSMIETLVDFITDRETARISKELGKPRPWTTNEIIQQYRFCNMHRENDTVTKWIAHHWRIPNDSDPDLWFAMFVARYINLPSTLIKLYYPVPWNNDRWLKVARAIIAHKEPVFNGAYIIPPTAGGDGGTTVGGPKHESIGKFFTMLWRMRDELRPIKNQLLSRYCDTLVALPGVGTFMAGQVIADLKFSRWLAMAPDWWDFAVSGPGSRRGLNRIVGRDINASWKETEWHSLLEELRAAINTHFKRSEIVETFDGQDMQNCLCEFDKYCRVLFNEGKKPKQKYPGRPKFSEGRRGGLLG
jgi:hypothetical protein